MTGEYEIGVGGQKTRPRSPELLLFVVVVVVMVSIAKLSHLHLLLKMSRFELAKL